MHSTFFFLCHLRIYSPCVVQDTVHRCERGTSPSSSLIGLFLAFSFLSSKRKEDDGRRLRAVKGAVRVLVRLEVHVL